MRISDDNDDDYYGNGIISRINLRRVNKYLNFQYYIQNTKKYAVGNFIFLTTSRREKRKGIESLLSFATS